MIYNKLIHVPEIKSLYIFKYILCVKLAAPDLVQFIILWNIMYCPWHYNVIIQTASMQSCQLQCAKHIIDAVSSIKRSGP